MLKFRPLYLWLSLALSCLFVNPALGQMSCGRGKTRDPNICQGRQRDVRGCCKIPKPKRVRKRVQKPEPVLRACLPGQVRNAETSNKCCYPGQYWSKRKQACQGAPQCPQRLGLIRSGNSCACPAGKEINQYTEGHCCWQGQEWVKSRGQCMGEIRCRRGYKKRDGICLPLAEIRRLKAEEREREKERKRQEKLAREEAERRAQQARVEAAKRAELERIEAQKRAERARAFAKRQAELKAERKRLREEEAARAYAKRVMEHQRDMETKRIVMWGSLIGGGTLLLGSGVTGIMTQSALSDRDDALSQWERALTAENLDASRKSFKVANDDASSYSSITTGLLVGGVALLALSAYSYLTLTDKLEPDSDDSDDSDDLEAHHLGDQSTWQLMPIVGEQTQGLGFKLSF